MAIILFLLFPFLGICVEPFSKNQILYNMHTGNLSQAFDLYREHRKALTHHDIELIQQIGITLLDQGIRSSDPEIQLLTLFGAGVSAQEKVLYILEESSRNANPKLQLIALNYLALSHHDRAEEAIQRALGSDFLLIRLEALLMLAEMHHPRATSHAEALSAKLPQELLPLFPQIFASIGDERATKALRKLLAHPNEEVRIAAILAVAKFERDDLLPQIRTLSSHGEMAQQEGCAMALGSLSDESSIPRLERLAQSHVSSVRLAANLALYRLGKRERQKEVEREALEGNVFAIAMLGEMEGSEGTLAKLVDSQQLQTRINASIALLNLKSSRCLPTLWDILITNSRDFGFEKVSSHGLALDAWHAIPSAKQSFGKDSVRYEISLRMREEALKMAVNLPEKEFLNIAERIFEAHQNDLILTLVDLLDTLHTEEAKALLKKYSQKAGAPLIRHACNLALFKMKEEGPFEKELHDFIVNTQDLDLIRFRPTVTKGYGTGMPLTPEEKSSLLIAAFEAFTKAQTDKGIDVLLDAMQHGNPKNRYALAGLLIRIGI